MKKKTIHQTEVLNAISKDHDVGSAVQYIKACINSVTQPTGDTRGPGPRNCIKKKCMLNIARVLD